MNADWYADGFLLASFEDQVQKSGPEFWRRFASRPAFDGRRVLDLGCGVGAMTLEMAAEGAHVLGVDLDDKLIAWARDHTASRSVKGSMEFVVADVRELASRGDIDLVLSKDTFEHIDDVPGVLRSLRGLLTPEGSIWTGFSPLYYSPWGDHERTGMKLPWAHTLPWPIVRRVAERYRKKPTRTLGDIGLNGMTPAQFRRYVADAGFAFQSVLYNRGDKRLMSTFSYLRRFALLERYTTIGIYAVLASNAPAPETPRALPGSEILRERVGP
jgi:ubiquinone/menaquinone biosynthesis C-methylase UbiE